MTATATSPGDRGAPAARPVHYAVWSAITGGMEHYITVAVEHFRHSRPTHLFSLRPSVNGLHPGVTSYTSGSFSNMALYRRWFSYCRQHRHDLFHLVHCGPVILLITLLAGVRRPIYHIHGTHHGDGWMERTVLRTLWRLALLLKPLMVANSAHSARMFREQVADVPMHLVPNGFDAAPLLALRRRRTTLRHLGCAARIAPGKNTDLVLRLFESIASERPDLELHFAGTGELERDLRDRALASPFSRRIHFHGWVTDMPAFYARMDLLVFPSAHESFGNVLAEALINGLPVLTSDVPVFADIHGDPDAFTLGDPRDEEGFRRNFLRAVGHFDELAAKAFAASPRIADTFAMERHLEALEHVYALP